MIRFEHLKTKPALMSSLTGLTLEGFRALLRAFATAYEEALKQDDDQRIAPHQRSRGAGQKGAHPNIADKLVFILFYFRVYPVQVAQGFFFGMGQPQANEWIHRLSPVLKAARGYDVQLPARRPQAIKAVLESCPGLEFIMDGTEQRIRRPQQPRTPTGQLQRQEEASYPAEQRRDRQTHGQNQGSQSDGRRQTPRQATRR